MPRLLLTALLTLLAPAALAQTCTTTWTNAAGGSWETPANWTGGVPGPASTACITLAGTYTVAQSSADRTVAGLVVGGAAGTQTLTTFNRFTVSGNSLVRPSGRWELLNRTPGGGDGFLTGGTATVEGVFVQNGGTTLLDGGGTFDVAPGGRWEMREQASAGIQARPGTFRLRGTLDAAYTSTQTIEVPLDVQGGTVRVSQGRLDVRGGTLAGATVDAAAGATLLLISSASAPFTVSGTLAGAPAGEVYFNGGTFAATSGEVVLALGGAGLLLGGSVNLTSGGGTFLNTGLLTHAETGSNFATLNGTTLRNTGRFVMPARGFGFQNGGLFRNDASGVAEINRGGGFGGVGGTAGRVENAGTILANGAPAGPGSGATAGTVSVPYDGLPGSVVRTQTGRLDFQAGGQFRDASFDVPAGTALYIAGSAPYTVSGTLSGTLAGELAVFGTSLAAGAGGATLALGGTGLSLGAALRSAGGQFVNTGVLVWNGGTSASAVVVENRGTMRLVARVPLLQGAVLRNVAGATAELFSSMEGDGRFENAGLLVGGGAEPSVNLNGRLRSLPGSEIRARAGGPRLDLDAPASRSLPDGSALTGTGQVLFRAGLEPEGTVSPGTDAQPLATLSSFNGYRPSLVAGSPRLVIDVDAGGQSDVFATGGGTRLGGALVVRVRPGYTPAVGDQWTALTNATSAITGQFSQVVAEGAPSGIAFVAELAAGGTALVVRAVAVAPGGAITVSTTTPVGGGVRPVFLTGPGAAGVSAVRLECTACLDPAAFGTIPAQVVGSGTSLVEARFDLTSPRAFGLYRLVLQSPGQPDQAIPVTVRPFLGYVVAAGGTTSGARVRPPGFGYNPAAYALAVRTNTAESPFALPSVVRQDSSVYALAIRATEISAGPGFNLETDTEPDRTRHPRTVVRLTAGQRTDLRFGLRISPEDVLFPGQAPSGPDDPRIPFGEPREIRVVGTQHLTLARAAAAVSAALRGSASGALTAFVAVVDTQNPGAADAEVRSVLDLQQTYATIPRDVLRGVLAALGAPAGLFESARGAFDDAFDAQADALAAAIEAAHVEALTTAPAAVQALFDTESRALFPEGFPPQPPGRPIGTGIAARGENGAQSFCRFLGFGDSIDAINGQTPGGGGGASCEPPAGPYDPNDKTAESELLCETGTVSVGGEPVTRCVRYFVPRALATEPVLYTVQFENLPQATAPAEFVTITDEIDPGLDLASLRIESTSSDSTFSYTVSGRTVTFRFVGINLPPNVNAPEGEGYVRFSLRPVAGLPDNTEIRNDASIVFDFNPPIATPEVVHQVREVVDVAAVVEAPDFAAVGRPVPFRVLVSNLRGDVAANAAVTISTGTDIASAVPSTGTCAGAGPVTCTFDALPAGQTATVDIVLAAPPLGLLTVSAAATTSAFDGFTPNNTDAVSLAIVPVGNESEDGLPRELTLSAPRPNPVRGAATLRWGMPAAGAAELRVYDLLGREVARVADGAAEAGWHEARLDAAALASGVYIVRLQAGDETRTRRITVLR